MPILSPRHEFLDAVALALREFPGASIVDSTDIGARALELAANNWEVLPLGRKKRPRIKSPHLKGSEERKHCHGECGQWGHGVYDATTDLGVIAYWWGIYPGSNIGCRVPAN